MKIVGEQTVRNVLRFLEREDSIIKDILAGKPSDTASHDYLKEDYKTKIKINS